IGRYVFLPGDPGRCEVIAQHFDNPKFLASHREHTTWVGELDGERVAVTSTGMGGPSTAIAVEELIHVGADTFMRVGTAGAMQPETQPGDIAVVNAAIRDEGTGLHYLPMEFPAVADQDLINALVIAAKSLGKNYHVGVSQSKDSFYGQHSPDSMPVGPLLRDRWDAWVKGGCLVSEMECATLFLVGSTRRVRTGGVMMVMGHHDFSPMTDEEKDASQVGNLIPVAIEGMRQVIKADRARNA
ncbi:MAG: nucleoside phosphorylase, partial [Propionibacteriaceae bacterium]|nr:nucleoside phosphorylase [Propionibacteriaceae bacterium]